MKIRTINDVESFNERLQNGDILMNKFVLKAPYKPTGDQPQAIAELVKGFKEGN